MYMVHCGIITLHFSQNTEIEVGVKNEFPPQSSILKYFFFVMTIEQNCSYLLSLYFTVFFITKVNVTRV